MTISASFNLDFSGTPVSGKSPLTVSFSADAIFVPNTQDYFQVSAYAWCFDHGHYPEEVVITESPTIEHTYTGTYGITYDVQLSAILLAHDELLIGGNKSILKQDYICIGGIEPIRYNKKRELSLTRFLPNKFAGGDVYALTKVFEDYLNNMFIGNDGMTVSADDPYIDFDYNKFHLPDDSGTISILEKSQRLTELQDPDLIDIENIQHLASNMGYNISLNRDEVGGFGASFGTPDSKLQALSGEDQNRYLRFMTSNLPNIYKIKTTDSDIQIMLYTFGLVGNLIKYFTDTYKKITEGGKWVADYSKKLEEVPTTYYPTPHFAIVIETDKSDDLILDTSKRSSVIRAVESIKPVNTVFKKLAGHVTRHFDVYVSMKTRMRRYIRIALVKL